MGAGKSQIQRMLDAWSSEFEKPSLKIDIQLIVTTSTQPTSPTKKSTSTIFVARSRRECNMTTHRNSPLRRISNCKRNRFETAPWLVGGRPQPPAFENDQIAFSI